ncbi:MAG: OsmC family protein [Gemmatimonadetes bacterium]|nr:OsmC family protein [Gemmatimonadota bacterium]
MPVKITGRYIGDLKTRVEHPRSGASFGTAAPLDNNGDGSSFSPTDLIATSLGSCMLTVMGIAAQKDGIPFGEAEFSVEKHMLSEPRRVGALPVVIRMPGGLTTEQRARLERVALHCPVHHTLHPDVLTPVRFEYPDAPASEHGSVSLLTGGA